MYAECSKLFIAPNECEKRSIRQIKLSSGMFNKLLILCQFTGLSYKNIQV